MRGTDVAPLRTELHVVETVPAGSFHQAVGPGEATGFHRGSAPAALIRRAQEDNRAQRQEPVAIVIRRRRGATCGTRARHPQGDPCSPPARPGARAARRARLDRARRALVHRPPRVAFLASGDEIADLDHRERSSPVAKSRPRILTPSWEHPARRRGPRGAGHRRRQRASLREHLARASAADSSSRPPRERRGARSGAARCSRARLRHQSCGASACAPARRLASACSRTAHRGSACPAPVSTMVTFELFVRPRCGGCSVTRSVPPYGARRRAGADHPRSQAPTFPASRRRAARRHRRPGRPVDRPQGSDPQSMARANALLIVPRTGDGGGWRPLHAILLDDPHHVAEPRSDPSIKKRLIAGA